MTGRKTRSLDSTVASQRRRQIIDATRACIEEEGIDRVTLRKVAERTGVSHTAIGYHFHGRRQLIDATLQDMAERHLEALAKRNRAFGPEALSELVERSLDPNDQAANFVVQMIDAGLHDPNLRGVHNEFIEYACGNIERDIRIGIDSGSYRTDLNPKVAARLIHSLLIWWGSELANDATSIEMASDVGKMALDLLKPSDATTSTDKSAIAMVRSSLLSDPNLDEESAKTLLEAFEKMYSLVARTKD